MAENSKIEWCHHTFNPWWGCAKVSPGCDHCYAERDAGRFSPHATLWGVDAGRRSFGDKHWNEPRKWDKKAKQLGIRFRVFCASMADVFDKNAPASARERLWALIRETPHLDWLLLTKRIGNVYKGMLPLDFNPKSYPNVWLGISVVNQEEADRDIPKLLSINARVRWLSMEPLLGPVDLTDLVGVEPGVLGKHHYSALECDVDPQDDGDWNGRCIDWVIVGGESGHGARPMHPNWAHSLRDQCVAAGIPFLFKQWGEWAPAERTDELAARITMPAQNGDLCAWPDGTRDGWRNGLISKRVGKKAAGRLLDGRTWDGYPK